MPTCTKPARGSAAGSLPPISTEENNPCGKLTVATAGGVDMSAHALCYPHLVQKLGFDAVRSPVVTSTS